MKTTRTVHVLEVTEVRQRSEEGQQGEENDLPKKLDIISVRNLTHLLPENMKHTSTAFN